MIALDTFASQRTFRALLDALAHPGRRIALPDGAGTPPALLVPLALADLGQRVAVVGADVARWAEHLSGATSCALAEPADADQVVVLDGATADLVDSLRRGTALAPEEGCRLVLACQALGSDGDVGLELRGPGVDGRTQVHVDGISTDVFTAIRAANASFPAGIDTFLVAADHTVVGLPRSLAMEVH